MLKQYLKSNIFTLSMQIIILISMIILTIQTHIYIISVFTIYPIMIIYQDYEKYKIIDFYEIEEKKRFDSFAKQVLFSMKEEDYEKKVNQEKDKEEK